MDMNTSLEMPTFLSSATTSLEDRPSYDDFSQAYRSYLGNSTDTEPDDYFLSTIQPERLVETWKKVWAHLLLIISPLTIAGNGLVVATIVSSPHLRNRVVDLFVANLAAADLCFGAFVVSIMGKWVLVYDWRHGDIACRLTLWAEMSINAISNNALASLSISKFLYVAYPFHFDRWMNKATVAVIMCVCWIPPMIITIPGFLVLHPKVVLYYNRHDCELYLEQSYTIFGTFILFIVPLVLIFVFGILVLVIAHQHRRKIACLEMPTENLTFKRSSWKALRSFVLVVLAYLLLQGPLFVGAFVQAACYCVPYLWFYDYLAYPFWLSGVVNPCIYFFSEKYYRQRLFWLVSCGRYRPPEVDSFTTDHDTSNTTGA